MKTKTKTPEAIGALYVQREELVAKMQDIVDAETGNPILDGTNLKDLGSIYPQWKGGFTTSLRYKNLSLTASFAASYGGNDLYRVIYGHNMHTGEMFAGLLSYTDEYFYRENPNFTLCTPEGDKTCHIFSCHSVTDGDDLYNTSRTEGDDYNAFIQQLYDASDYVTGVQVPENSKVLTLSTCESSYTSGKDRYVIHAYIEE